MGNRSSHTAAWPGVWEDGFASIPRLVGDFARLGASPADVVSMTGEILEERSAANRAELGAIYKYRIATGR